MSGARLVGSARPVHFPRRNACKPDAWTLGAPDRSVPVIDGNGCADETRARRNDNHGSDKGQDHRLPVPAEIGNRFRFAAQAGACIRPVVASKVSDAGPVVMQSAPRRGLNVTCRDAAMRIYCTGHPLRRRAGMGGVDFSGRTHFRSVQECRNWSKRPAIFRRQISLFHKGILDNDPTDGRVGWRRGSPASLLPLLRA